MERDVREFNVVDVIEIDVTDGSAPRARIVLEENRNLSTIEDFLNAKGSGRASIFVNGEFDKICNVFSVGAKLKLTTYTATITEITSGAHDTLYETNSDGETRALTALVYQNKSQADANETDATVIEETKANIAVQLVSQINRGIENGRYSWTKPQGFTRAAYVEKSSLLAKLREKVQVQTPPTQVG